MICKNCKKRIPNDSIICPKCKKLAVDLDNTENNYGRRNLALIMTAAIIAVFFSMAVMPFIIGRRDDKSEPSPSPSINNFDNSVVIPHETEKPDEQTGSPENAEPTIEPTPEPTIEPIPEMPTIEPMPEMPTIEPQRIDMPEMPAAKESVPTQKPKPKPTAKPTAAPTAPPTVTPNVLVQSDRIIDFEVPVLERKVKDK